MPKFALSTLRMAMLPFGLALIAGCTEPPDAHAQPTVPDVEPTAAAAEKETVTAAGARQFLDRAEAELKELGIESAQAAWVQANFITADTQAISARAQEKLTTAVVDLANEAARFNDLELDADTRRKLDKLKLALTLPTPQDRELTKELTTITSELEAMYGQGKYCREGDEGDACWDLTEMTRMLANERDPALLQEIWTGWRSVSPPMKDKYVRMVEIANQGANDLGYADLGTMWRSKYDMPAAEFASEMDRLWGQVQPLYNALHCHVRAELAEQYGEDVVALDQPIPAHLLGNMWAQQWGNIYELVAPGDVELGYDLDQRLEDSGWSEVDMVKQAEGFFSSLGFEPLPKTFWERSLFTQPEDRDVVCHASAWSMDYENDLRIKMCIQKTAEDFSTIHHELGHNYYQRAYNQQPLLYQESANDGFHEAIGDTVALSVTPDYLKQIGLIDQVPPADADIGLLLSQALDKVAFLPFGLLVDKWRWNVFDGTTPASEYNQDWWELRTRYQGIAPPVERSEDHFDPGAKYHIPGNTPYSRYFLAHILQFQFHRELCKMAGYEGPLHRCSIYGNEAAGKALIEMLEMGSSKPWQDALEKLTGSKQMDASAIIDYFAPLKDWLDEQNQGRQCGW